MASYANDISKQEQHLHKQIKDTYLKVWCDLLEQKVREQPPDYLWLVNLYKEIRERLTFFLRKKSTLRKQIEEAMDVELFDQMIRNNAFQGPEFYRLVCFVFDTCLKLGSPARDNNVKQLKQEILTQLRNGAVFATLIPLFFKNTNLCIDNIYKDLYNLNRHRESKT